jgi:chromosome segregation protein
MPQRWPRAAGMRVRLENFAKNPTIPASQPVKEDRVFMRLKKLIVHGFKSFADRTEFVFDCPITGIVGPNGCGKSNVVDAFKWVLGEQSAKSLRGDAMLDVIFNGSGGRKPSGMAEVVLVFDNPAAPDNTRTLNLDTDEVHVGRRLFRDGSSEYQLNNQTTRLKDIRELFFDTGVGVDAYSVIEQGRVSLLLESNPQERRLIFEEAAGISKFKARKKESQRKLERVDQNLLRVTDIVEEVEKRLRSVKVQAGRARTYREHSARLSELRLTYAIQEYHTHHSQLSELTTARDDAQFQLDDAAGNLAQRQNELATQRNDFEALAAKRQQVEYELVQAGASLQSARQRQQYARQQLAQLTEQLEAFAGDRTNLEAKLEEVGAALEAETLNLQQLSESLEAQRKEIDQWQQAYRDDQLQLNSANQEVEQQKSAILDLMRKLSAVSSRLGAIDIERKNIAQQQTRLNDRRTVVLGETEALEIQRAQTQTTLDETLSHIADQQAQLDARREESASLGRQIAHIGEQLGAAREHRSGLLSRQKLLTDMEAKREGVSEGVKSVLRQRDQKFSFVHGLVADVLRVDVEHAHVIEAALDGKDQFLIAANLEAALACREALDELEGRVNIITPSVQTCEEPAYDWNRHSCKIRLASDLVKFEAADAIIARQLLGSTIVVDSLEDAAMLRNQGPAGYRFVTIAGQVLEADGTLRAGPLTAAMGLLSRRSELEALAQQIAEVDGRIAQLTALVAEGNTTARGLEEQQNVLRTEVYRANTTKVELTSRLAQNQDKQSSLRREAPLLERELQTLADQLEKLVVEQAALTEKRSAMEADQSQRQHRVEQLVSDQKRLEQELLKTGEQLTAARVALGQVQEKQLAARQQVERQKAAQGELAQQIERIARSAEALAGRRGGVELELAEAQTVEAAQVTAQEQLGVRAQALGAEVAAMGETVKAMSGQVESLRGEHIEREQSLHSLQLKLSEVTVRLETLVARTMEELQLDLPAQYSALSADGGPGYQSGETDWELVANEIKELRDKIHRLGNVNLDAIGEQDELEQRQQFLSGQLNDLTTSKKQLEELIDAINVESSARFEQTFNAVREHFQGMFRKLFGGGKADIYLETELDAVPEIGADGQPLPVKKIDPLDAGIEIIARPPGKQPVSISQLSGGEKTMTCVALLMSIFKSKPSPFCILDEVDAALDEANNQRFNLIVQEFLEQSQFIIITHSKRTMQIADVLYGVTMQEQGVSKRVSVKFDQVDSAGRINETAAA